MWSFARSRGVPQRVWTKSNNRKRAPQLSSGQRLGQGDQLGVAKGYQGLRQDGAKAKEAPGLFLFLCFWPRLGWDPGPCLRGKC